MLLSPFNILYVVRKSYGGRLKLDIMLAILSYYAIPSLPFPIRLTLPLR